MPRFVPIGILLSLVTLASLEPLGSQTIDSLAFKDLQFRMAGPFRGGRSSAVTGFPANQDRWLMGTTGGGVWETTDNGISWQNISEFYLMVSRWKCLSTIFPLIQERWSDVGLHRTS